MRIQCFECGKDVTTELPNSTIFRAIATCPECEAKKFDVEDFLRREIAASIELMTEYENRGDTDALARVFFGKGAYEITLEKIEQSKLQGAKGDVNK